MKLNIKSSLLLFCILLIITLVLAQIITTIISIENKTALQNTTDVLVPILLENNESIAGFQFEVNYTTELAFKDIELTSRLSDFNTSIEINSSIPGNLKIAALVQDEISPGGGAILNIIFDVDAAAVPGEYDVPFSYVLIGNISAKSLETDIVDGVFTILADSDYDKIPDINDSCSFTVGCELHQGCNFGLKGWLPPISTEEEFDLQQGATLPLKFNVTECDDHFYEDSEVRVRIVNESLGVDKEYNASGEGDDYIRINQTQTHYIVNIHTNQLNMSLGNYSIYALFNNNYSAKIGFELIQQGRGKGWKK